MNNDVGLDYLIEKESDMSTRSKTGLVVLILMTLGSMLAWAAPTVEPEAIKQLTLGYVFERGGKMMYVLAAMSVLGVALIMYCFYVMREIQVAPRAFLRKVVAKVSTGSWAEVREMCLEKPCPLGEVVLSGVDYVENVPKQETLMLKEVIEAEGTRQGVEIQIQPQFLLDLAILSPMVGLLGSVFGMFTAFNAVALDAAKAKPLMLASGVAEALFATAGGLMIGIPAMAFYGFFRSRSSRLVSRLESASSEVLTAFLKGK